MIDRKNTFISRSSRRMGLGLMLAAAAPGAAQASTGGNMYVSDQEMMQRNNAQIQRVAVELSCLMSQEQRIQRHRITPTAEVSLKLHGPKGRQTADLSIFKPVATFGSDKSLSAYDYHARGLPVANGKVNFASPRHISMHLKQYNLPRGMKPTSTTPEDAMLFGLSIDRDSQGVWYEAVSSENQKGDITTLIFNPADKSFNPRYVQALGDEAVDLAHQEMGGAPIGAVGLPVVESDVTLK